MTGAARADQWLAAAAQMHRPDADAKSKVVSVEIQRQVEMDMARTASKDNQNIKAQLADVGMGILLTVTSAILLPS